MLDTDIFEGKHYNAKKGKAFGFIEKDGIPTLTIPLGDPDFLLEVCIPKDHLVEARVYDTQLHEEYERIYASTAGTEYIARLRKDCENHLTEICSTCFEADSSFHQPQTLEIIEALKNLYGDPLEFLWLPDTKTAIYRHPESKKWYAALLTISSEKLSLPAKETIEVLDLKEKPERVASLVDHQKYFPGYHMSKKSWYTIVLDHRLSTATILEAIAISRSLNAPKVKKRKKQQQV